MTLEERFKALMKNCEHLQAKNEEMTSQNTCLRRQLGESMRKRRKEIRSSPSSTPSKSVSEEGEGDKPHSDGSSSDGEPPRHPRRGRRPQPNFNQFRVEIPEFEGKLDSDEFFKWMQTFERIFEYKEILEEKKIKLIALKLKKYASLWWTNLLPKRVRPGKGEI